MVLQISRELNEPEGASGDTALAPIVVISRKNRGMNLFETTLPCRRNKQQNFSFANRQNEDLGTSGPRDPYGASPDLMAELEAERHQRNAGTFM